MNKPNVQYCGGCGFQFGAPTPSQDRTIQQQPTPGPFNPNMATVQQPPTPGPYSPNMATVQQQPFPTYNPPGPGPAPQPGPMNPPPSFPPYAPPQPQNKSGKVWKIISGVLGGLILVFGLGIWGLVKLAQNLPEDPPAPDPAPQTDQTTPNNPGPSQNPPANNPPANNPPSQGKNTGLEVEPGKYANVKVVAQGDFQRTFSAMDARAGLVAAGKGNSAQLYQVKTDGSMALIKEIAPTEVGNVLQVHISDMLNGGKVGMIVVYEKAIYFVDSTGKSTGYKASVKDATVADVDGDGQFETLLQQDAGDGTYTITVVRFAGEEVEQVASVKGQPAMTLDFAGLTVNKKALLFNAAGTDQGVQLTLYSWDNAKGAVPFVQHISPTDANHPAEFASSGIFGAASSSFVISRSGSPATVEVIEVDDQGGTSIGAVTLPGNGRYMVCLGKLVSDASELLAVDENGHYYIISLQ